MALIQDNQYKEILGDGVSTTLGLQMIGAVRNDNLSSLSQTDGAATYLRVNSDGALYVSSVGNQVTTSGTSVGAGVSISMVGGVVKTENFNSSLIDNNTANFYVDSQGNLLTTNQPRELIGRQLTTITNGLETTIVDQVANEYHDLKVLYITNDTLNQVLYTLKDNTTEVLKMSVNAGKMKEQNFNTPLTQAASGTSWTITAGTSASSTYITAVYNIVS